MPNSLIAKRYAKAIFDLSLELNTVENVKADMELILSVCTANKDFSRMLKSPVIRYDKKMKVMEAVFKDKISELSMRFLALMTRKRREKFVGSTADEYVKIYKKFNNIFTVYLDSAKAMNEDIRKKVIQMLEDQTKGSIELIEEVKEELVGGFVMSYDDYKYDASISYQLRKLKKGAAEINFYIRGI